MSRWEGSSPLARGLPDGGGGRGDGRGIIPARAGFTRRRPRAGRRPRDHPRSRGVYPAEFSIGGDPRGSSPLARGLRIAVHTTTNGRRIIPARAGFTWAHRSGCGPGADHPRSRGVYPNWIRAVTRVRGSSPLARGLPGDHITGWWEAGIIPARAGFTWRHRRRGPDHQDHPRSRGVYMGTDAWPETTVGSSPLARGLPGPWSPIRSRRRIIPARAGFTTYSGSVAGPPSDHPRSRGVYGTDSGPARARSGSSPLARGLQDCAWVPVAACRIIPARAGFTPGCWPSTRAWPDHPRSRGVYSTTPATPPSPVGSSPLARGLRDQDTAAVPNRRIIPARAGFTGGRVQHDRLPRDHPRSRGVYVRAWRMCSSVTGSSPLARGLLYSRFYSGAADGIIPARAGFTPA